MAFSGAVFLWGPAMPAKTVHAESCMHENYEWVTTVKPTCSRYGKMVSICQDCEEILETEIIEKTEHKGKWEKTKEATCVSAGLRSYLCKNCHTVIDTEEIPMKNHKFIRTTKGATCQSPKIIEKQCSSCGFTTTEQSGNKLNHKYGNWFLKSIKVKGKTIKIIQARTCKVCKEGTQMVTGTAVPFSGKHTHNKYFYKFTKSSGKIVILCPTCHKSVTGKISGGTVKFTKPKKDNSRITSRGWKTLKQ